MNNKKRNNKGFSLVELIVVVAIMAVLVGVLAPAYLTYVEKSRAQKDASALEEVRHAVEIAVAEERIYDTVTFDATKGTTVTVTVNNGTATITTTATTPTGAAEAPLLTEVKKVVGTVKTDSKAYENGTYTITLESQTSITGLWADAKPEA